VTPSRPRPRLHSLLVALVCVGLVAVPGTSQAAGWAADLRPLWVGVGGSGGGTLGSDVGVGYGSITIGLRLIPIVPEVTLREGVAGRGSTLLQHHGNIAFGARFLLPAAPGLPGLRPTLRVAFSHRHDSPVEVFKAKPMATIFGTGVGITHRSGIETGGGLELALGPKQIVGVWVQGTLVVLPSPGLDPVTGLVEGGISFALGPRRP
jgi:hypothetical protein